MDVLGFITTVAHFTLLESRDSCVQRGGLHFF